MLLANLLSCTYLSTVIYIFLRWLIELFTRVSPGHTKHLKYDMNHWAKVPSLFLPVSLETVLRVWRQKSRGMMLSQADWERETGVGKEENTPRGNNRTVRTVSQPLSLPPSSGMWKHQAGISNMFRCQIMPHTFYRIIDHISDTQSWVTRWQGTDWRLRTFITLQRTLPSSQMMYTHTQNHDTVYNSLLRLCWNITLESWRSLESQDRWMLSHSNPCSDWPSLSVQRPSWTNWWRNWETWRKLQELSVS